jgi:hypothetical protein
VALALYLWEHRNFVLLFGYMLLLVENMGYVLIMQECIVSNVEVGMISFVGPCKPYIPRNSQDDFHHREHIGHH